MRILTVRQPWAWAIIHGGKGVENRVRNLAGAYRGPVAIHAGLANDIDAWKQLGRTNLAAYSRALDAQLSLRAGVILGVVDLTDVHHVTHSVSMRHPGAQVCWDSTTPVGESCSPWAQSMPDGYHLVFAEPRALPEPIPFKGALGLRELDPEIAARIEREAVPA